MAAFSQRPEVQHVHIFYPLQYANLFDHQWDLVVIEGWFPAINDFIQMVRIHNKRTLVMFFCLDPSYPGLDVVSALDLDGLLTNSRLVQSALQNVFPTQYVMLAADPLRMAPIPPVGGNSPHPRDWGAVYIGAGGGMTHYKHLLLDMLTSALPSGLRLHGSHWDEVPELRDVWQGPLARGGIAEAYSSAHVVLASTTDDQRVSGMINNRIFEALSCAGVVVSEHNPAVVDVFGDIVLSISAGSEVGGVIAAITDPVNAEYVRRLRHRGREAVVRRHSWHHRVVSVLDLFYHVRGQQGSGRFSTSYATYSSMDSSMDSSMGATKAGAGTDTHLPLPEDGACEGSPAAPRRSRPRLAWVAAEEVLGIGDYTAVHSHVLPLLAEYYCITTFTEADWRIVAMSLPRRQQFDIVLAHVLVLGSLDLSFQRESRRPIVLLDNSGIQKNIAYIYGMSKSIGVAAGLSSVGAEYTDFSHYDVIWHRSLSDIRGVERRTGLAVPAARLQHVFAVRGAGAAAVPEPSLGFRVVAAEQGDGARDSAGDGDGDSARHISASASAPPFEARALALRSVVVCTWDTRHECSAAAIAPYTAGKAHTLLLIGGNWEDWVANNALFDFNSVNITDPASVSAYLDAIARTIHISAGRIGDGERLIAQAEEAVFMGSPLQPSETAGEGGTGAGTGAEAGAHGSIWPLVAAAVGGVRIRLTRPDPRVYALMEEGFGAWGLEQLGTQVRLGVARVVGMSTQKARVLLPRPVSGAVASGTMEASDDTASVVTLYMDFENIVLGRDGQCCILFNGGSKLCLMRTARQLDVRLNWAGLPVSIATSQFLLTRFDTLYGALDNMCPNLINYNLLSVLLYIKVEVEFSLQGTVFAESSHVKTLSIFIPTVLKYFCPVNVGGQSDDTPLPGPPILSTERLGTEAVMLGVGAA
jgi:hypothetical protein